MLRRFVLYVVGYRSDSSGEGIRVEGSYSLYKAAHVYPANLQCVGC